MDRKFLEWVKFEYGYETIDEILNEFDDIARNYQLSLNKNSTTQISSPSLSPSQSGDFTLVKYKNSYVFVGNTEPIKQRFKDFGCKWITMADDENHRKGWMFGKSKLEEFKTKFSDLEYSME